MIRDRWGVRSGLSVIVVSGLMAMALFGSACGKKAAAKEIKIGMMPKSLDNPYFASAKGGATEAATALGVTLDWEGPEEVDDSAQVAQVNAWAAAHYDAIAVSVNNSTTLSPALAAAQAKGIKIVTWDSDSDPTARSFFCEPAQTEGIAETLLDQVVAAKGPSASYAVISAAATAPNQNAWLAAMETYHQTKYPGMTNLTGSTPYYSDDVASTAGTKTTLLLSDWPLAQAIVMPTTVMSSAAQVLLSDGLTGPNAIFLTGLDKPNDMAPYLKGGVNTTFAFWNPTDIGYMAVEVATALAKGELAPTATTFSAGRLGTLGLDGPGVLLLGKPTVFNASNYTQYNF